MSKKDGWNPLRKSYPNSDKVNAVSIHAEILYLRLIAQTDDNGNYEGEPFLIMCGLLAKRAIKNEFNVTLVQQARDELIDVGLAKLYQVGGKIYLHLVDCKKIIRKDLPKDIRFPEFTQVSVNKGLPETETESLQNCNETETECNKNAPSYSYSYSDSYSDTDVITPASKNKSPTPKPAKEKIIFNFESGQFEGITNVKKTQWADAFPAVDIELEIKRAALWALNNPKKRKNNWGRFLVNWFSRTQERGGSIQSNGFARASPVTPSPQAKRMIESLYGNKKENQ